MSGPRQLPEHTVRTLIRVVDLSGITFAAAAAAAAVAVVVTPLFAAGGPTALAGAAGLIPFAVIALGQLSSIRRAGTHIAGRALGRAALTNTSSYSDETVAGLAARSRDISGITYDWRHELTRRAAGAARQPAARAWALDVIARTGQPNCDRSDLLELNVRHPQDILLALISRPDHLHAAARLTHQHRRSSPAAALPVRLIELGPWDNIIELTYLDHDQLELAEVLSRQLPLRLLADTARRITDIGPGAATTAHSLLRSGISHADVEDLVSSILRTPANAPAAS